jgi:hypothetical protein
MSRDVLDIPFVRFVSLRRLQQDTVASEIGFRLELFENLIQAHTAKTLAEYPCARAPHALRYRILIQG